MLKPSGKRTQEKVALTPEECRLLLERVKNHRAKTFLLIALHTGMRRGEILGLQWNDIDFSKKAIQVKHNAVLSETTTTVSENLKTAAGSEFPNQRRLADLPCAKNTESLVIAVIFPIQKLLISLSAQHSPHLIPFVCRHCNIILRSYQSDCDIFLRIKSAVCDIILQCCCRLVAVKKSRHEKYLFLICFFKSRHEEYFCGSCFFKSGY